MDSFQDSGLKRELLDAIQALGYQTPTEIQKEAVPFLLNNTQDLIALAQTGTGKTAAFGLPIINQIDTDANYTQALILCPTRELCLQISKDIESYTTNMPKIKSLAVYGGSSITDQIRALKKHPQIIIGTPGRMNDMIRRKALNLSKVRWVVLDEADEMLSMGFKDELENILIETPDNKQTLLFSATMSKPVEKIAKGYMSNPHKIAIGSINAVKRNITHHYCVTRYNQKLQVLHRLLDASPENYTIIFCRTRIETQQVADYLMTQGFLADALHGDLSQAQRDTVMKKFRLKNIKILVATDVAARGLDVNSLTHVIHFSLPDDPEVFVHRSGRTGRAGKFGLSICLIKADEIRKLNRIESECKINVSQMQIPTNEVIINSQMKGIADQLAVEYPESEALVLPDLPELENISKEQLIKQFVYLYLKNTIEYYEKHPDITYTPDSKDYNSDREDRKSSRSRDSRDRGRRTERADRGRGGRKDGKASKGNFTRFFFNLGKRDDLTKSDLLGLINRSTPGERLTVGDIDIMEKFTFFEVETAYKDMLLKAMNNGNTSFKGKRTNLEVAN